VLPKKKGLEKEERVWSHTWLAPNDVNADFTKGITLSLFKQYRVSVMSKKEFGDQISN